jgi:hypothetical protein
MAVICKNALVFITGDSMIPYYSHVVSPGKTTPSGGSRAADI